MLARFIWPVILAAPVFAEIIPLDPKIAFDDLESAYRKARVAERISVRVFSEGGTRSDTILFQFAPPATVQVTFGPMRLWSDSEVLRVEHHLDGQAYFETPIEGRDTLGAIRATLPPFPAPHLALALADDPMAELTPYMRGVRWTTATVDDRTKPPTLTIEGVGDRAAVTLIADAGTGRIRSLTTILDGGRARVELTCEPLAESETPEMGIDAGHRRATIDVSELRPRAAAVRVGDRLAGMELLEWRDAVELPQELAGPAAVVFVRRWKPGLTPRAALRAAEAIVREQPGFQSFVALIMEPGTDDERALIDAVRSEASPHRVLHSVSPEGTIERFSEAAQVMMVLDRGGVVRAITDLVVSGGPPSEADTTKLADVIRAALKE